MPPDHVLTTKQGMLCDAVVLRDYLIQIDGQNKIDHSAHIESDQTGICLVIYLRDRLIAS